MKSVRPKVGNGAGVWHLLAHPIVANVVQALIFVVLALGGYIWNTETGHLRASVQDLKQLVENNQRQQWEQLGEMRREVNAMQSDLRGALLRTQERLLRIIEPTAAKP